MNKIINLDFGEKRLEYKCEGNDNSLKIYLSDGELDEIHVGCEYLPEHGYSVIGIKDLQTAFGMIGYKIVKEPTLDPQTESENAEFKEKLFESEETK